MIETGRIQTTTKASHNAMQPLRSDVNHTSKKTRTEGCIDPGLCLSHPVPRMIQDERPYNPSCPDDHLSCPDDHPNN